MCSGILWRDSDENSVAVSKADAKSGLEIAAVAASGGRALLTGAVAVAIVVVVAEVPAAAGMVDANRMPRPFRIITLDLAVRY